MSIRYGCFMLEIVKIKPVNRYCKDKTFYVEFFYIWISFLCDFCNWRISHFSSSHASLSLITLRKRLSAGTVPVSKKHLTGTVPANKDYLTGTVPVNKEHITGTLYIFCGNEGEMLITISWSNYFYSTTLIEILNLYIV